MRIEQRQAEREAERERKREEAARKGRPPPDDESVSVFRRDRDRGHRGWILKKGAVNTQFKRRYFEVLDGKLSWYDNEASHAIRKPKGWVECHGLRSAAGGQDADGPRKHTSVNVSRSSSDPFSATMAWRPTAAHPCQR